MANSKTRPTTRMLAMLLALFTFLGVIPLSPFALKVSAADPGSAKPTSEMLDNFVLRALEYTGYDVQAQKDNDTLYVQGYYAGKTPSKILSGIGYGTGNGGGVATVPDSRTKTGRAPDIAKFKSGGLECGSFVSYVFLNYLPNIEGVEMQGIKEQLPNGTNSDDTWYSTLKTLTSQGKAKQITIGTPDFSLVGTLDTNDKNAEIDYVDWSKLEIGDIIVFGTESSTAHVAIYAGTCHNGWRNTHFIIHVGNERGPEISEARYMADSGSKSSVPIAVYRLIPVEPAPPPEPEVGTIEVNKHDDSGTALSGAVFTATNTSTRETVTIGPTDSRGYAKKDNVPYGTYEVAETTFPSGYTSSGTSKWTVTVGKSTPTVTVNAVNTAVDGYGKIVKLSEDGKVSGIRFHIEGSGVDMDVTTGSDGTVTQGLRPGTYTVTELASDEYVPQAAQTLTVVADRTATVTFSNTLKRGTLKVTKTAYDGFVEDITFHLYGTSDSGQEVNMYATTDSSGVATFNDVLVGSNYVLEEVDTPERYVVPDIEYVDIEYNVVARADVYNDEKVGSAKVIKTSDDDNVRGIRFHLYGTANSGERVDLYATTDRDGIADFGEVPSGTEYTVEEVDVPDWYEEPREQEIDVIEGRTTEVRFHNTLKVGDLTVTKTSEDDNVSGRRFHLYGTSDNGERVDEYAETNSSGKAYFRDIPIGTDYVLEEVGTPDWYIVPSPQTVDIEYDDTVEVSFYNELKRGDLRVTKTSFDGLVAGITFRLTGISDSGESVNETAVTNDAGVAEFHDILVGSNYRLEEEGAADYYVIPDIENVEVTWGDVTAQSVHNAPKVGTLKVMKTADDGKVSGRRFHLYGKADSGTVIDLYADTDGNGVATFSDVEIGKGYTVEEVGTPEWYIIPDPQTVDIEYGITVEASFNNALKRGDLVVHKTSEDDKVEGRTFRLHGTSLSGEIVDMTASTDAAGTAYFNDIPIGNGYILEETGTPEWYIVPVSVTVDITENVTVERSFENILKRGSLKVTKTSFDGLVEGLQFRLTGTSLSGIPVDVTVSTDSDGIAIFENILIGNNYRLEEVGTPNYYIIPDMQNANITWNDVTVTTFYNDAKRGNLTVHKTSEDDEVEGRRFHLFGISDSNISVDEYAVTDEFGTAYFRDILIGRYILEEVDTPEKYIIPEPQMVDILYDTTIEKSFNNKLKRGALDIIKTSEDGFVQGMKFHLFGYSMQGEYVDMYAVTGADGIAHFKDVLISGETPYTIEEVETAVRYVVPDVQTAPIEWEKVTERTFVNRLKKWNVTIKKVDGRTTTPQGDGTLAGAVYGIYRGDELVDTYTTDTNGQFVSKYYVCGDDWIIREISPSEGYLLDNTEYHIGAEAYRYEIEYNDLAETVAESAKYGNIAVIKHTDNGDTQIETPEVGAKFEIFLKAAGSYETAKESERDILICDEIGFAQSKELPYGVYTVHQTEGWNGSEKIADFDVYICEDGKTYNFLINNHQFEAYLRVVKIDAETGKPIPVAGVGFKIYDPDGNEITMTYTYPTVTTVDTFYTNENGYLVTPEKLPFRRGYSVVEVSAPYGYVLDSNPVYFDVTEESSEREDVLIIIEVSRPDKPQKGTITVSKYGEVFASVNESDGLYTPVYEIRPLSGAVYEIVAADDIYTPDGTLRYAAGTVVDTVTTGDDGTATSIALYLGKYTVREVTAPYGYLLNDTPANVELVYAGENVEVTEAAASFVNDRQRVSVSLSKVMEKDDLFGIGSKDEILRVRFGLFAKNDIPASDGSIIPSDGLLEVISVNENGIGTFNADLPLGEYYVREIATDEHYVLSDEKYPVVFDYAGQNETTVVIDIGRIENELIYGSIKGYKTDRETGADIAGAVFGLFRPNETVFTTENAILTAVSDANGIFTFENVPYGKWTIYELAPADGYLPNNEVRYEVEVKSDEEVIEIYAVNDMIPEVKTTATVNGEHDIHTNVTVTIEDVVEYKHLIPGKEYVMRGVLMDKATGKPFVVNGSEVTAEMTFTPDYPSGTVVLEYTFDGNIINEDTVLVVFETLYRNGKELASHADIDDEGQTITVHVPEIGTTATAEGGHTTHPNDTIEIQDIVRFENLIVGKTYTVKGILIDKSTGEPFLVNGVSVTAETTFVAESNSGEVTVTFVFDGSGIETDSTLVAFESLYNDDFELAVHADINDEDQTVTVLIPEIGTTANVNGEKSVHPNTEITIEDIVTFENLIPGKEYVLHGILINKATGEPFLVNGKEIVSEITFTPDSSSGTVTVTFVFNGADIDENTDIVVYERLLYKGYEIALHSDINDKGQTVTILVPEIDTTATADGGHTTHPKDTIEIVDVVRYENLIVGKTYTVKGVLMDKSTGEPFLVNGVSVTAETTFVAESNSGEVTVTFVFDGSGIETDTTLVAFESLYHDDFELAVHADIEDADQTVTVLVPEIGTTANVNGEKSVHPNIEITIEDVVAFENLISGKEYVLRGVIMNKATGEPFLDNGKEVVSEVTFTPDSSSGAVVVMFVFNGADIDANTYIVVFERLFYKDYEVAAHTDINDEGQTVTVYVPDIGTTATADGNHETHPNEKIEIVDVVKFENLIVGKTYTVKGVLIDKSTGEPFLVRDESVTAETTFVAESEFGEVTVTFVFDGSGIKTDTTLVAFESLYHDDFELAIHADIEDADQTVTILVPEIGTTATVNGCNIAETSCEIVVEDEVRYEGLIQGKEYVLRGILMDKATGNPYTTDGKEITSEAVFTASSSSGKVTVTFTFDGSGITSDTELVVFETLYLDNSVVTRHENINDDGQTVKIIPKREIPKTGDESPSLLVPMLLMLASLSGLAVCLILGRKRKKEAR